MKKVVFFLSRSQEFEKKITKKLFREEDVEEPNKLHFRGKEKERERVK